MELGKKEEENGIQKVDRLDTKYVVMYPVNSKKERKGCEDNNMKKKKHYGWITFP